MQEQTNILKDNRMSKEKLHLSIIEKIINKGPLPNAESNIISRILNMLFYSSIAPVVALIYFYSTSTIPLKFQEGSRTIPIELLLLWVIAFLFVYTLVVYHASGKFRQFFSSIKPCLGFNEESLLDFQEKALKKAFAPPLSILILLIGTIPVLLFGLTVSPIYVGDTVTTLLLCFALFYTTILHWNSFWMLYNFLSTSNRFGRDIPVNINPFDPDKVGGLAPLSDMSTLAIFYVGLISLLVIPIWQIFLPIASYAMILLTSLLIPGYFLYSMRGVYSKLSTEKEKSLKEMNDEIQEISKKIRTFISKDHCNDERQEKEVSNLGQALNSIDIIYGHVRTMHTFPVNAEIMAKIFVSAILPILAVIIDFLMTRFL
jgi:ABC-type multidrug transport system fused ATPase/permease subunit